MGDTTTGRVGYANSHRARMTPGISQLINLSRWVAALLVLLGHERALLFADFDRLASKSAITRALYFVTGLGHAAVVVFFVISGYLVGGITLDKWLRSGPDIRSYFVSRASRIYTVLIPALAVGYLLDYIGIHWIGSPLYQRPQEIVSLRSSMSLGWSCFAGNLLMLQGISTDVLGTNGPLWSLVYEWWYYCLFALVAWAAMSRNAYPLIAALLLAALLPEKILLWSIVWLVGVAAHRWIKSGKLMPHKATGALTFFAALIAYRAVAHRFSTQTDALVMDTALGIAFSVLMASMTSAKLPLASLSARLADFSYSTYLAHFPALVFIGAVAHRFGAQLKAQPAYVTLPPKNVVHSCS